MKIFSLLLRQFFFRKGKFSLPLLLSMLGVSLGVLTLVVFMAISTGFEKSVKKKILGSYSPHLLIRSFDSQIPLEHLLPSLEKQKEILSLYPYKQGYLLVSDSQNLLPLLYGTLPKSQILNSSKKRGDTWISQDIAIRFGLRKGDLLEGYLPELTKISQVKIPKKQQWEITHLFPGSEYLSTLDVLLLTPEKWKEGDWLALKISDPYQANLFRTKLQNIYPQWQILTWIDPYQEWFSLLKQERQIFSILLFLLILISAFSMSVVNLVSILEKKREIVLLKLLGLPDNKILLLFLFQGLIIGITGTLFGFFLALLLLQYRQEILLFISQFGWQIDAYLTGETLPISLEFSHLLIIFLGSLFTCLIASLLPAYKASRTNLVQTLRDF